MQEIGIAVAGLYLRDQSPATVHGIGFELVHIERFVLRNSVNIHGGAIISDRTSVVCIGEITADTLENHGVNSFKIAKTKDTDGILKTIIKEVTLKEG